MLCPMTRVGRAFSTERACLLETGMACRGREGLQTLQTLSPACPRFCGLPLPCSPAFSASPFPVRTIQVCVNILHGFNVFLQPKNDADPPWVVCG